MNSDKDPFSGDFQRCIAFHGHICPGLAAGYRAASAGLEWLQENRAEDEEIVAVVETDGCGADAIQVLTGCTFGKGNLLHKDYGKHVYTIMSRATGKGIRMAAKPQAMELPEKHRRLIEKLSSENAAEEDKQEFWELHERKCREVLSLPLEELFDVRPVDQALPPMAKMDSSVTCSRCGEPAMASKTREVNGGPVCMDCLTR
jgi:formylmethanofuran dehydrogenase subunit E